MSGQGLQLLATNILPLAEGAVSALHSLQPGSDVLYVRALAGGRLEAFAAGSDVLAVIGLDHWSPTPLEVTPRKKGDPFVCPRCGVRAGRDGMPPAQSYAPAPRGRAWWYTGYACGNPDCESAGAPLMQLVDLPKANPSAAAAGGRRA